MGPQRLIFKQDIGCHGKKAQNLFANGQWRRQPDNLVALCKFKIIIIQFFRNWLFSQHFDFLDLDNVDF
jgi:hypothetical protein